MAADLYLREVDVLRFELSMSQCSDTVWAMATEIMDDNRHREEVMDAHAEKLAMFTHPQQSEATKFPDGEVTCSLQLAQARATSCVA